MRRIITLCVVAVLVGGCAGCNINITGPDLDFDGGSAGVWFTPNAASPDMLDLFRHPEQWSQARETIDVFQFYQGAINESALPTGDNTYTNFVQVDAFSLLQEWNIAVGLESGSVKEHDCSGMAGLAATQRAINRVQAAGGTVRYVAMDWPFAAWREACAQRGQTMEQAAEHVARYITTLKRTTPGLRVGDIIGMPLATNQEIIEWITAIEDAGATLDFVHLDIHRAGARARQTNLRAQVSAVTAFLEDRGTALGIIFWGEDVSSNAAFAQSVLRWIPYARSIVGGTPQHTVFQSWERTEGVHGPTLTVPSNIPETERFTHTWIINEGLDRLH